MEDTGYKVAISILVLFFTVLIGGIVITVAQEDDLIDNYKQGKITLQQYCDKATDFGTNTNLPPICYQVYNLKQVGAKQECDYNVAVKSIICKTVPILETNN